jgi:hypothetical protein
MDLFLPKSVEDVVLNDTPKKCIATLLVEAMKKFGYD